GYCATPRSGGRCADRKFPPGHHGKMGLVVGSAARTEPAPDYAARVRLRAERAARSGTRVAAVGEAFAGIRSLNGEPGRAPVRAGLSLGDTIAGLHGELGGLLALYQRDVRGGEGQMIDAAL